MAAYPSTLLSTLPITGGTWSPHQVDNLGSPVFVLFSGTDVLQSSDNGLSWSTGSHTGPISSSGYNQVASDGTNFTTNDYLSAAIQGYTPQVRTVAQFITEMKNIGIPVFNNSGTLQ